MTNNNMFPDVVGQDEAKKKLAFYINSYHHTKIMPNLMLCAKKGQGKSLIAKETAKQLVQYGEDKKPVMKEDGKTPKKKTFLEINASTIKSIRQFINSIVIPHVVDKDVTIFIDEASEINKDVTMSLLSMLNPNPTNRNTFIYDDYACEMDFSRQSWIFATSESHSIFAPLMDRLTRIDLQSYTHDDLGKILAKSAPEVQFRDGVLENISTVVRGNARQCVKMANDIRTFLCNKNVFGRKEWNELSSILSIKPLGLSPIEVDLLRFMASRQDGSSLTNLAARSGLSRDAVQKDYEAFLQAQGLMQITPGKGRQLTGNGYDYLKSLDADAMPC
jgi:Holliday junction resolvasome RuvABC ATP-dependent DNA helicase subunit